VKHTLVALMQNRPGVLNRVVSLFRRRGYNIESLAVGQSEVAGVSRMSLVVDAEDVEQVIKQLYRLVEVLKVTDVTQEPTVERETALVKLSAPPAARAAIVAAATACGATILDVGASTMVVEMTGPPDDVERFIAVVRPFGLKEMMRTGRIAMVRGAPAAGPAAKETAGGKTASGKTAGSTTESAAGAAGAVAAAGPTAWQTDRIA
jgi:acetolactate synthase-1/3 small subunit